MKKLTCLGYFCLIAVLIVSTGIQQTRAQQKGLKQVRKPTFLTNLSGQKESLQKVKSNVESAKAGHLTTGEAVTAAATGDAPNIKLVRRDPALKIIKADRPGTRSTAPQIEVEGGLAGARATVSPREGFGGKQ
jgi:hypothetical protein